MEAESSIRFGQGVAAAGSVHSGSVGQVIPGAGMIPSMGAMGALLAGFGMAPACIFLPGRPPAASAGYGADRKVPGTVGVWNRVALDGQPREEGGDGERAQPQPQPPLKGPWTPEEDDILKDMVREHGERKWAVIARFLPGRIGKQCRERWTNHLRPDIKKTVWTEEDDMALIEAHKTYGNRWSMIARFLPGRSENAVKNHWNATRRSLKAKRRLKKKKNAQALPGQFSLLEDYIRSLYPTATDPAALLPPVSPPSYNHGYDEVVSPPAGAAATPAGFDPAAGLGMMYLNAAGSSSASSSNVGALMNLSLPMLLDLNTYYYGEAAAPLHAMAAEVKPQLIVDHDQQQASYANLMSYPIVDSFMWQSSVAHASANANNAGQYYYGGGRDGNAGADDLDVVQMASREFLTPSQEEATLDLARFM